MPLPKPEPKALKAFEALVEAAPGATVKPMFGNFGAFANGQMFAGVFGDSVFVRLGVEDRAAALKLPGAKLFEPMKGRPMREYVALPPAIVTKGQGAQLWASRALTKVMAMPPKSAKKKAAAPKRAR